MSQSHGRSVLIIAEVGVNHNGSSDMALRLIDAAVSAGADAVKFQTFQADRIVTRAAPKAAYQEALTSPDESQFDMLRRLELDETSYKTLAQYCRTKGVEFISTPFDVESVQLLDRLGVKRIKVSSGDVTNGPLLLRAAQTGRPIILSTGMATLDEVEEALGVIAFARVGSSSPSRVAFRNAWLSTDGRESVRRSVTLLHCTSEYPAPFAEVNLRAMTTLRDTFQVAIGYSDHTEGIIVPIAAVALGAGVIEKHITLDRTLPGPDHRASLEPAMFAEMVKAIRTTEESLGSPTKAVTPSESRNAPRVRKSLVATRTIQKEEVFSEDNLGVKRPGHGISPIEYWDWLGRPAPRAFVSDDVILP